MLRINSDVDFVSCTGQGGGRQGDGRVWGCERRYADPVPKQRESSLAVVHITEWGHARKGEGGGEAGAFRFKVCVV